MYCKYLCGLFIRKTEVPPKVSILNFGGHFGFEALFFYDILFVIKES